MRRQLKFIVLATISVLGLASNHEEVSRANKDISFVMQVSASGASTPSHSYNLTKNPDDEPKILNHLTPLGQRQQFLIGSELRLRYVEEAQNFLNSSYDISQMFMRSTFDEKSILSAQAQLIGLYPPSSNDNVLTEWQQKNAVPPLSSDAYSKWQADIEKWQAELGDKALLDNINTFPINMYGSDDDVMLKMTPEICPKLAQALKADLNKLNEALQPFEKNLYPKLVEDFGVEQVGVKEALQMCEYLFWAELHEVELKFNKQNLLQHCYRFTGTVENWALKVDESLNYLTATELIQNLHDHIKSSSGQLAYTKTVHYKENFERHLKSPRPEDRLRNNAATQPTYVFLVAEDLNINFFIQAVKGKQDEGAEPFFVNPIAPSSILFFEVVKKEDGMYIEAFFNDEPLSLGGCTAGEACKVSDFSAYLKSIIAYDNVSEACKVSPQEAPEIIQ